MVQTLCAIEYISKVETSIDTLHAFNFGPDLTPVSYKMEKILKRFPVLGQEMFKLLDNQGLANCREVSKSWCTFLDTESLSWKRRIQKYSQYQNDFKDS